MRSQQLLLNDVETRVSKKKTLAATALTLSAIVEHVSSRAICLVTVSAHLVERTPDIDGTVLNDLVHHFGDGLGEVGVGKLMKQKKKKEPERVFRSCNSDRHAPGC